MKLNDNDYEILRLLVTILQESQNPVAIAVAAHDLGEYVRYYPRGKRYVLWGRGMKIHEILLCNVLLVIIAAYPSHTVVTQQLQLPYSRCCMRL